eukprot:177001-Amphidinium_carterae.4
MTSSQVIKTVKAAFSELDDQATSVDILHQIDDTPHEISAHTDLTKRPHTNESKAKEVHERSGHTPECPVCIRELVGAEALHTAHILAQTSVRLLMGSNSQSESKDRC